MFSATACGAVGAGAAAPEGTAAAGTPASAASAKGTPAGASPASPASGSCPARQAWAVEATAAGRVAWQDRLPADQAGAGIAVTPLVAGGKAVFAEENAVYAIRLGDGRPLWHRAFSAKTADAAGAVYGVWQWSGTVTVLTGQVSDAAKLTGLDADTGAVRWTLRLPKSGVLGQQAQGAGGTLAVQLHGGIVESVDLATGRVLWSRQAEAAGGPANAGPVTSGSVTAIGGSGQAVGYDSRTGRVRWTARGLPQLTELTAADGVLLAASGLEGGGQPTAVTALNPLTGKVEWRFDPGEPVTILGSGPAGVALATYVPQRREYLVNLATGQVRWSAAAFALAEGSPGQFVETAGYLVMPEGTVAAPPGDPRVVVRSAATGRVLWSAPAGAGGTAGLNLALVPLPGGQAVAVTTAGASSAGSARVTFDQLATGRRLASAALPELVPGPVAVAGSSVISQPDSPACAVAAGGSASLS